LIALKKLLFSLKSDPLFDPAPIATSTVAAIESQCGTPNFFHVFLMKNRSFKSAQIEENHVFYNESAFAQGLPKGQT